MTLFRNRIFTEIKSRFTQREDYRKTPGKMLCEDRGLDDASTSQGTPKIAGKPPEARKRQGRIPQSVSEGVCPC